MKHLRTTLSLLLLCLPALSAGRTIQNPAGTNQEVPDHISSLVCIGKGCLRMVSYLNAASLVVGVEQQERKELGSHIRPYLNANPRLRNLPPIGPGTKGDAERILAVNPQVILWADGVPDAVALMKTRTGIPVISFPAGDLSRQRTQFYSSLRFLGTLLERTTRADSVIQFLEARFHELDSLSSRLDRRNSVYVGGLAFQGCHGLSATQPSYTPFQLLGLQNVAEQISSPDGNPVQVELEQVLAWNPGRIYYDEACQESVESDFTRLAAFGRFRKNALSLWSSNSYGENWEMTLANAFRIADHGLNGGDGKTKRDQILLFLLHWRPD